MHTRPFCNVRLAPAPPPAQRPHHASELNIVHGPMVALPGYPTITVPFGTGPSSHGGESGTHGNGGAVRSVGVLIVCLALVACSAPAVTDTPHPTASPAPTPTPAPTGRDPFLWSASVPAVPADSPFNDLAKARDLLAGALTDLGMPALVPQEGFESSEAPSGDRLYLFGCQSGTGVSRVLVLDPSAVDELPRNQPHPWLALPTALFTGSARTQVADFLTSQMRIAAATDAPADASAVIDGLLVEITVTTGSGARETDVQIGVPHIPGSVPAACTE